MFRLSLAFVAWALFLPVSVRAEPPFRYPEGRCETGELVYRNGLPVLTVWGTPEEMGTAVGTLALRPGMRIAGYPEDLLRHYHGQALLPSFTRAARKMIRHFPADARAEMAAMAESSGADADRMALGNTLFDLKKFFACSALLVEAERSTTGGPLLARNLDYPTLGYAQDYSLVTVYHPADGRHAFASVGFPGLFGCLSGMNDAGLAVAVLEVFQLRPGVKRFDREGLPYAVCYRRVLEECATIDEAKALLESLHRASITNLVLADRSGVAVFEVSPRAVHVRPARQGACACTNHFLSDDLRPLIPLNLFHTLDRFRTLQKTARPGGQLGPTDLQRALHEARIENSTMQTMVFEPAALRLHLAIGACPSSAAEMKRLDLGPLLRAKRPAHD
jgi:hypothetical protein